MKIIFFPYHDLSSFPFCPFDSPFFLIIFFVCLFSFGFNNFFIDFDGYYVVRTDEGQPRPKYIFNKCVELTSTFLLFNRGLVHHHHRIFNQIKSSGL